MQLFSYTGWNHRYNLDGFLTYSRNVGGVSSSYVQLFRNGVFEAVDSSLFKQSNLKIPNPGFEETIINAFKNYISNLKVLDVGLPIFAFLTLLGVKGYWIDSDPIGITEDTIEKDVMLIPEIVIENFDFEVENILKPWFDAVWNACGFPHSRNYDGSGKWKMVDDDEKYKKLLKLLGFLSSSHASQSLQTREKVIFRYLQGLNFEPIKIALIGVNSSIDSVYAVEGII